VNPWELLAVDELVTATDNDCTDWLRERGVTRMCDAYYWTPWPHERGEPGKCFRNAYAAAEKYGYDYCEGFAWPDWEGRWIHHAWVLTGDGYADPTWMPEDELDVDYWGIVFGVDESRALHELWPAHGTHIDALLAGAVRERLA
jgi:hypothetical protein